MAEGMTLKKEGVRDGEKEGQKKSCCSKLPFSSFPLSGDPAKSIRLTLHINASTRAPKPTYKDKQYKFLVRTQAPNQLHFEQLNSI